MANKSAFLLRPKSSVEQNSAHPRSCCVPWALKYIQSILRERGFLVHYYDIRVKGNSNKEAVSLVKNASPEYIIIHSNSIEYKDCQEIISQIKAGFAAKIILVGQYASYVDTKPKDVDFWFKGECEKAVTDFLLGQGQPNQDEDRMYIVEDLDNLPFPYFAKGELSNYHYPYPIKINKKIIWGSMLTSRGCPHNCLFCTQVLRESYGKKFRSRSAENVLSEMKHLVGLGANVISFEDDSFTVSSRHVNDVCDKIISGGLKVRWICQARIDEVDFELLKKMRDAGCVLIRFGVESGSAKVIEVLGKAKCGDEWLERAKKVFCWTHQLRIPTDALFMMGAPSETIEEVKASIKLARKLKPDIMQVSFFTLYHGSIAYDRFKDKINLSASEENYHYEKISSNLSAIDSEELIGLQKVFYRAVLFRPAFLLKHLFGYLPYYLTNRGSLKLIMNFCKFLSK
ncbi:MAG: radical SAM protein [Candidatus Omnitrophica bacterium]|nr:radical SAM protein [Candidatus Omnitrophota bacterium]